MHLSLWNLKQACQILMHNPISTCGILNPWADGAPMLSGRGHKQTCYTLQRLRRGQAPSHLPSGPYQHFKVECMESVLDCGVQHMYSTEHGSLCLFQSWGRLGSPAQVAAGLAEVMLAAATAVECARCRFGRRLPEAATMAPSYAPAVTSQKVEKPLL